MNTQLRLGRAEDVVALGQLLDLLPEVRRFDEGEHHEASTLAHAFADLEEAFTRFLTEHLPNLTQGTVEVSELPELLLDIGEDLRHILYHLADSRFYGYLHVGGDDR